MGVKVTPRPTLAMPAAKNAEWLLGKLMKLIFVPLSSFLPHSKKGRFVCASGLALEMRSTVWFFGFRNDAHIYYFWCYCYINCQKHLLTIKNCITNRKRLLIFHRFILASNRGRYFSEYVKIMPTGSLEIQKLCSSKTSQKMYVPMLLFKFFS